ncbi:reverse transcriptase domain-containing protein [Tanacetum coccineum]
MRELKSKLFKGTDDEDAHKHVQRVLKIVDHFHFPDVTHDAVMLRVFPITFKGPALRWINRLSVGLVTTWDLLEKSFIRQYCPPFKTTKKLEIIYNFKQEMDETLYYAWERYNDLLFKCPHHDLNCQQKVHIFYTRLDIPTLRVLDSKGFIPLMTPTQALISIQVMAEHYIHLLLERTTMGKEYVKEPVPRNLPAQFIGNPYRTREPICAIGIPEEIKEDEGDMNDGCDITVKDVERLRKILIPPIHALPNLKPITVHITPPNDDYVASATNPILNKHLNEFSLSGSGIRSPLDSYSCGSKVLSWRNHLGETRLFYRHFARSQLLQLSLREESNTQGSLLL